MASAARAAPVRYDFDGQSELDAAGWEFNTSGAVSSFAGGMLELSTQGYAEWMLMPESAQPWFTATDESGWSVEARVRLEALACDGGYDGPGIWIHDGTNLVQFHLSATAASVTYPELHQVAMTTTDTYHVYRLQNLGKRHLQLVVDGQLVLDVPRLPLGSGSETLMFGDLGGCQSSQSSWDHFEYDTVAPEAVPGDADDDGVDNASDDCALLSNANQADADADGIGDACDACPSDPQNDQDADGLCAGDDVCPEDARNDADNNGVCDTEQCAQATGECLPICNCYGYGGFSGYGGFVGIDYAGGGGYGAYAGTTAQGGSGGSAGAANQSGAAGASATSDSGFGHSGSSGGCACSLRSETSRSAAAWFASAALAALIVRARRRRTSS